MDIEPKRSKFAHLYPAFIIQALNGTEVIVVDCRKLVHDLYLER